jgi:hypothetical protein
MDFADIIALPALAVALLLAATLALVRWRQRRPAPRAVRRDTLDTIAGWPPESARVMTICERQSYELLRRALPGFMVLAQVPLSRFVRVPSRNGYGEWLQRVGHLSADLLLCDAGSRVLAVIDIRSPQETERSRKRHERIAKVLKSAGIRVHVWMEGSLPGINEIRATLGAELGGAIAPAPSASANSRSMPLIPVAEIEEILAEGDHTARDAMEPVPSAFFDDMELAPTGARR